MSSEVTQLLREIQGGKSVAADHLFSIVHAELREQAGRLLRSERRNHTLGPTALVHEAYLRLVDYRSVDWRCRAQFLAVAAQAMRRILVDHARHRNRIKRGGGPQVRDRIDLDLSLIESYESSAGVDIESLNDALASLASIRPQSAQVVDMRFFAEMTTPEVAEALGCSMSTVEREWRYARAWLKEQLGEQSDS